jgi:molecular chaperone GrpE (heat shock protein)
MADDKEIVGFNTRKDLVTLITKMNGIIDDLEKEKEELKEKNEELEKEIEEVEEKHLISCVESQERVLEGFSKMRKRNADLMEEAKARSRDIVLTSLKKMKTANEDFYELLKTEGVIPA